MGTESGEPSQPGHRIWLPEGARIHRCPWNVSDNQWHELRGGGNLRRLSSDEDILDSCQRPMPKTSATCIQFAGNGNATTPRLIDHVKSNQSTFRTGLQSKAGDTVALCVAQAETSAKSSWLTDRVTTTISEERVHVGDEGPRSMNRSDCKISRTVFAGTTSHKQKKESRESRYREDPVFSARWCRLVTDSNPESERG